MANISQRLSHGTCQKNSKNTPRRFSVPSDQDASTYFSLQSNCFGFKYMIAVVTNGSVCPCKQCARDRATITFSVCFFHRSLCSSERQAGSAGRYLKTAESTEHRWYYEPAHIWPTTALDKLGAVKALKEGRRVVQEALFAGVEWINTTVPASSSCHWQHGTKGLCSSASFNNFLLPSHSTLSSRARQQLPSTPST